jgi:protein disulfide-isomerase A6
LPDILDSQADGRNGYIDTLKKLATHFRKRPFGWSWTAAGAQSDLEKSLGVGGAGYPAFTAINFRKKRFSTSATAFSEANIKEFINVLVCSTQCW